MKGEVESVKDEKKSACCGSNFALLSSHFFSSATIKKNFEELGI